MNVRAYLPSASFTTLTGALLTSATLIFFAYALTHKTPSSFVSSKESGSAGSATAAWQSAFASSTAFEEALSLQAQAAELVSEAQTGNLTENVARAILINTSAAQGQGLGGDEPTQEQIIANALAQLPSSHTGQLSFEASAIATVPDSKESLRLYGNGLAETVIRHTEATYGNTMFAISVAVDNNSGETLSKLASIASDYRALARDIAALPTPQTLLSPALQMANNYAAMADACVKMQSVIVDPLSGVVGVQSYNTLTQQNIQAFTQVAYVFKNKGVQFTEGDLGAMWPSFLAAAEEVAAKTQEVIESGQTTR